MEQLDQQQEIIELKAKVEQLQNIYNTFLQDRVLSVNGKTQQHVVLNTTDIVGYPSKQEMAISLKEDSYIITEDGKTQRELNNTLVKTTEDTNLYVKRAILKASEGVKQFAKESELKAYKPSSEDPTFAYAVDTSKSFEWVGGAWEDLGVDNLKLAKDYTDLKDIETITSFKQAQDNKKALQDYSVFKKDGALTILSPRHQSLYYTPRLQLFPTVESVYNFLDEIVLAYPAFVSKEVIGHLNDIDICQYVFKAPTLENSIASIFNDYTEEEKSPLKFVVMSGVHGDEKESVIAWITFFYELIYNWKNSTALTELRHKTDFVFIPILNVTGYNTDTRNNFNGIDLNRNADASWSEFVNGSSGAFPADQYETQLATKLAELHSDATLFIDGHDMAALSARKTAFWIGTATSRTKDIALDIALSTSSYIGKNFNILNDLNEVTRITENGRGTIARAWQLNNNKDAYLLEVGRADSNPLLVTADRRLYNTEILREAVYQLHLIYSNKKVIAKPLELSISTVEEHIETVSKTLFTKLDVSHDFHTEESTASFLVLNEDLKIIDNETSNIVLDFHTDAKTVELVQVDEDFKELTSSEKLQNTIIDFHSDSVAANLVLVDTDLKELSLKQDTVLQNVVLDFHNDSSNVDLIPVDSSLKELQLQQQGSAGLDVLSIPSNEQEPGEAYLENHFLKVARTDYPEYYYKTSQSVIPHADTVYAFYDKLLSENPTYITKTTLGTDTEGYPIYGYTFTPPTKLYWGGHTVASVRPTEIVITSGIHGAEKMGIIAGISFFDNLVNHWNTEEHYDKLRFACKFTIYPACNPYGIRANTRGNINGVDLNRNFDSNWSTAGSEDPTNVGYKGTAPFSEVEAQVLKTIPDIHPNANLFMDLHQQGEVYLFWFGTILKETIPIVIDSLDEMTMYVHKHIKPGANLQQQMTRLAYNGDGTVAQYFQLVKKRPTILIEMSSSNHAMLTGQWIDARKVAEHSIITVIKKVHENTLKQLSN